MSRGANSHVGIIMARKRSLRRLCFYTYLSVILFTGGGGSASVHARIADPQEQTLPPGADTPPRSRHPPQEQNPLGADPPGADTSPQGADTPPAQCMLGDTANKRAVRTGIHTSFAIFLPKTAWECKNLDPAGGPF